VRCEDAKNLLESYADGELDLLNNLEVEKHLTECEDCSLAVKRITSLTKALSDDVFYYRAPDELREKLRFPLQSDEPARVPKEKWWNWRWLPAFATAAIAIAALSAMLFVYRPLRSNDDMLADEMVSAHVRSMMIDNHLMDVPSSDQHTVKPWFDGKLDFAPPVIDLTPQGFVLI